MLLTFGESLPSRMITHLNTSVWFSNQCGEQRCTFGFLTCVHVVDTYQQYLMSSQALTAVVNTLTLWIYISCTYFIPYFKSSKPLCDQSYMIQWHSFIIRKQTLWTIALMIIKLPGHYSRTVLKQNGVAPPAGLQLPVLMFALCLL